MRCAWISSVSVSEQGAAGTTGKIGAIQRHLFSKTYEYRVHTAVVMVIIFHTHLAGHDSRELLEVHCSSWTFAVPAGMKAANDAFCQACLSGWIFVEDHRVESGTGKPRKECTAEMQ